MKKKTIIWIVVIGLIIAGVFYFLKNKKSKVEYLTEIVQKNNIKQSISATGEIVPLERVDLSFENGGKIKKINVEIGDQVKQGEVLAELDAQSILAGVSQAKTVLNIEKEKLKLMRRKWDNYKPEEKEAQKLAVKQKEQAVWDANSRWNKTKLKAPIAGIITKKNIEVGETVAMNMPIFSISAETGFEVKANIPESDIAGITIGQTAELTMDALSADKILLAKVVEIYPSATIIQDVVYYKIKLAFDNINKEILSLLREGMSVDIDILTEKRDGVLSIPAGAIKNESGKKFVEILLTDNKTEKVEVQTGLKGDGGDIEIISGLNVGDEVIILEKKKKKKK